jgi:hypothetical protein
MTEDTFPWILKFQSGKNWFDTLRSDKTKETIARYLCLQFVKCLEGVSNTTAIVFVLFWQFVHVINWNK